MRNIALILFIVTCIFYYNIQCDEISLNEESTMITSEHKEHSTPRGGDYSEIFYFDDDGNSVDKEVATKAIIREYKKDGTLINEVFAIINKPK